jgi:hypothetical protein
MFEISFSSMNGVYIGTVQRRRSLRLALETGQSLGVLGNLGGQKFEGNEAMQLHVLGFIIDAHPRRRAFR